MFVDVRPFGGLICQSLARMYKLFDGQNILKPQNSLPAGPALAAPGMHIFFKTFLEFCFLTPAVSSIICSTCLFDNFKFLFYHSGTCNTLKKVICQCLLQALFLLYAIFSFSHFLYF